MPKPTEQQKREILNAVFEPLKSEPPVRSSELVRPHRPYVFLRAEGFYVLEMASDADARLNAENNPGTLRVENLNGETVWPNTQTHARRERERT